MDLLESKIMIVDDDESVILPIEMSLQEKGYDTISFTDGESALEYLKNNRVSVILLDYHMEPHMNGDEFIRRFREFNVDTLIYLQTAYSEELPAIEMLAKYQIQGYIDKGKRADERMQLIISAVKQAQTLELVKRQQKEIEARTYKEEFLGKFIGILMGEIKEKSFAMVGCIDGIYEYGNNYNNDKDAFDRYVNTIRVSINDLNEMIDTLDINKDTITFAELKRIIEKLFNVICAYKKVELNFSLSEEYRIINDNARTVIYILTDIIKYLIDSGEQYIGIQLTAENDKNLIVVKNKIENKDILDKIEKLAAFDDSVNINNSDGISIEC